MKRFVFILFILLIVFAALWFIFKPKHKEVSSPKMTPIALKKHSEAFNASVDKAMHAYLDLKNSFVEEDTSKAKQAAKTFMDLLDKIPLDELKKDTAGIFESARSNSENIKSNALSLISQTNVTDMRKDFSGLTEAMYPSFFKTINYEGPDMYLQNCPMAFGEDQGANWISNSKEIVNPYLGKHDPKYSAAMLHCGEVKDTIKAK